MSNKNLTFIILIVVFLVVFGGILYWQMGKVREAPPVPSYLPSEEEEEEELITLTGIIRFTELEAGCYYLETSEGEKYELFGLGEEKLRELLDREITVKGKIREDMFSICMIGTIFEVQELTGETEIDTSTWQTYRNEEYGFEVKYPQNGIWESEESNTNDPSQGLYFFLNLVYVKNPEFQRFRLANITISVNDYWPTKGVSLQKYLLILFPPGEKAGCDETVTNPNGVSFCKIKLIEPGKSAVVRAGVERADVFYAISSVSLGEKGDDFNLEIKTFDQILSTFKFIE